MCEDKTIEKIHLLEKAIEVSTGYKLEDYTKRSRKNETLIIRYIFSKIARDRIGLTYQAIADIFNMDHSTILNYIKKFDSFIDSNKKFKESYSRVLNNIDGIAETFETFSFPLSFTYSEITNHLMDLGYSIKQSEKEESQSVFHNKVEFVD